MHPLRHEVIFSSWTAPVKQASELSDPCTIVSAVSWSFGFARVESAQNLPPLIIILSFLFFSFLFFVFFHIFLFFLFFFLHFFLFSLSFFA